MENLAILKKFLNTTWKVSFLTSEESFRIEI